MHEGSTASIQVELIECNWNGKVEEAHLAGEVDESSSFIYYGISSALLYNESVWEGKHAGYCVIGFSWLSAKPNEYADSEKVRIS